MTGRGRLTPWVALALAGSYFLIRGPLRALRGGVFDFGASFYIALRTFALGGNPYRLEDVTVTAAGVSEKLAWFFRVQPNSVLAYPPGFFAFYPLAC